MVSRHTAMPATRRSSPRSPDSRRIPAISWMRIAQQIAIPALLIPAAVVMGVLNGRFAAWLVTAVANALVLGVYTVRTVNPPVRPSRATCGTVLSFGTRGYVGTFSHHGFLRIDLFFLGARSGPEKVGLYALVRLRRADRSARTGRVQRGPPARVGDDEREVAARLIARIVRGWCSSSYRSPQLSQCWPSPCFPPVFGADFADSALPSRCCSRGRSV